MLIDYHIHLKGRYEKEFFDMYIDKGIELGIEEFCITEHIHRFRESIDIPDNIIKKFGYNEDTNFMKEWWTERCTRTLDEYINFIQGLKEEGYPVKLGCEMDYLDESILESIVEDYPWDFVIGSVHWIEGWGFDHSSKKWTWENKDVDLIYKKYFNLIKEAVKSKLFDVIGHFDVIKLFNFFPKDEWSYLAEEALKEIAQNGIGIELNTAGLRKPVEEMYPNKNILKKCREYGIHITLGSDAHKAEEVGYEFVKASKLLYNIGYKYLTIFDNRKAIPMPIKEEKDASS